MSSWGYRVGAAGVALVLLLAAPSGAAAAGQKPAGAAQPDPERREWGGTPVLSGNSDVGIGFGGLISLARFSRGYAPFRWRLEALVMMTAKQGPDGGVSLPYHDDYLKLDLPGLAGGRLRLFIKLGFGPISQIDATRHCWSIGMCAGHGAPLEKDMVHRDRTEGRRQQGKG